MMPPAVRNLLTPNNVTAAAAWGGTAVTGIIFLTQVKSGEARRAKSEREVGVFWGGGGRTVGHADLAGGGRAGRTHWIRRATSRKRGKPGSPGGERDKATAGSGGALNLAPSLILLSSLHPNPHSPSPLSRTSSTRRPPRTSEEREAHACTCGP